MRGLHIERPGAYCAALYIRLSKEDENEGPSQSVQNQKTLLEEFAAEQGLRVYDRYIDDGFSGTSFDRPAFNRMLGDIEGGRVNMVITKDLSRLGRDYIMTGHYMERYFPEHRVRYLSLLDGIDTGVESTANDITPFRAIMNDMYAKDISKKIRSVKHEQQRRGEFVGGKALYGYRMHPTEKHRIIVDEAAAKTVRRIFSMALSGMSCRKIAEGLNQCGVPTPAEYAGIRSAGPHTGLWSSESIARMLQNETYLGKMVQGRRARVSYKSRRCLRKPEEEWSVVEGTHEALVSEDTFQKVQLLLESRRHTRSRTYDFPLKGLIFCHECGHPLGVVNRKNARGEDVLYLICRTYQRFPGVCSCHSVKEQTVYEAVLAQVQEICGAYLTPELLLPAARAAVEQFCGKRDGETAPAAVQGRLAALNAKLDRLYLDRLNGLLAEEDFRRIYGRLQTEREKLAHRQQVLSDTQEKPASAEDRAKALVEGFLRSALSRRELLAALIDRVELTERRDLILCFRFRKPAQKDAGAPALFF